MTRSSDVLASTFAKDEGLPVINLHSHSARSRQMIGLEVWHEFRRAASKVSKLLYRFVASYAAKCYKCDKWRKIATKEEYETIHQDFTRNPWYCGINPILSCEQQEDIIYDTSRVWVLDTPDIPKPPPGTERQMVMRSNLSKVDVYNVMPNGKRTRSTHEVEVFLEQNPEYKSNFTASSFSFATPKIVKETVSDDAVWRVSKAARTRNGMLSGSN